MFLDDRINNLFPKGDPEDRDEYSAENVFWCLLRRGGLICKDRRNKLILVKRSTWRWKRSIVKASSQTGDRNDLDNQLFDTFAGCQQILRQDPQQTDNRDRFENLCHNIQTRYRRSPLLTRERDRLETIYRRRESNPYTIADQAV
ncbi:MAG: hypothetical protein NT070_18545 [Cyanobacteria bacterium]|nr:hypothetical protein [Cyanobacteriota bacterium]